MFVDRQLKYTKCIIKGAQIDFSNTTDRKIS